MKQNTLNTLQHNMNWKELRETILLLNLSVVQIDSSMSDGTHSVNQLIESFTAMSSALSETQNELNAMMNSDDYNKTQALQAMQARATLIGQKMSSAIIAFQFYDKLSQRLSHVAESLDRLCNVIASEENLYDEAAWKTLKTLVKNRLSMEDETMLYDLIYQGIPPKEAIAKVREHLKLKALQAGKDETGDIEFF
jgi:hypothetical protein